jgi:hypothetical protein
MDISKMVISGFMEDKTFPQSKEFVLPKVKGIKFQEINLKTNLKNIEITSKLVIDTK